MTFAMGGAPAPGSDRILVELFQILKDDAVESAALNMQYSICTQYAICRLPAPGMFLCCRLGESPFLSWVVVLASSILHLTLSRSPPSFW